MKIRSLLSANTVRLGVLLGVLSATLLINAAAQAQIFTPLDAPLGTKGTYAYGFDGNTAIGNYTDADGQDHGFYFTPGGNYTTFDPSGSIGTYPTGIYGGTIVGAYTTNGANYHGFVRAGDSYTILDHPDAGYLGTFANGVHNDTIVGYYYGINGSGLHGFSLTAGVYTTLDAPFGSAGTFALGVYGNTIVGGSYYYEDAYSPRFSNGFILTNGNYTAINHQGSKTTVLSGIYGDTIVGNYRDGEDVLHGFLYTEANGFVDWDHLLGVKGTSIDGIYGNTIVGTYTDIFGIDHGFMTAIPEPSTWILLGFGCLYIIFMPLRAKISNQRAFLPRARAI